jgi:hypothetical protein
MKRCVNFHRLPSVSSPLISSVNDLVRPWPLTAVHSPQLSATPLLRLSARLARLLLRMRSRKEKVAILNAYVAFHLYYLYIITNRAFLLKAPDRRPEVRVLEYHDIPGITLNHRYFYIQRLMSSPKKVKSEHSCLDGPSAKVCTCPFLTLGVP